MHIKDHSSDMSKYASFTKEPGPLSQSSIMERLALEIQDPARITVTPLLSKEQVGEGHIDLRLGYGYIVPSKATWNYVGSTSESNKNIISKRYTETWVTPDEIFMLHPGQLVLASTLEYIRLPLDVSAQVESKSSWGRLGIIVATATVVHPGYEGVLTLELYNAGELPIKLRLGVSIAQLWMVGMSKEAKRYNGKYKCPVGPEAPDIQNLYEKIPEFDLKK